MALGRSLHFGVVDPAIITQISKVASDSLIQAIRHSQIFLQNESVIWDHFVKLKSSMPERFGDFIGACNYLRETVESLEKTIIEKKKPLEGLTVFETLLYGSVFTYKALASIDIMDTRPEVYEGDVLQNISDTLNDIFKWKLKTRPENDLKLSEKFLLKSLESNLFPLLYPVNSLAGSCLKKLELFENLAKAISNLNVFRSSMIQIFCYDDDHHWSYDGERLVFNQLNPAKVPDWEANGKKLIALQLYWLKRAGIEYAESVFAHLQFGEPENDTYNREAYLKAKMVHLKLAEIFGLDNHFELENGTHIQLINLLHPLELTAILFKIEHIAAFQYFYQHSGDWILALRRLSESRLSEKKMRYPLIWTESEEKAQKFLHWTASDDKPKGNIDHARSILDFWSSDLKNISQELKNDSTIVIPELHEKPVLRLGRYHLQLPWLTAAQDNSIAVINNLRRIGKNRSERMAETHRIETRLGELFEEKGFTVVWSYQPEIKNNYDPGEVDLLCFMDNNLLLLEVKSGYQRKTLQDAWVHRTSTLRKAARQLQRKKNAIIEAITTDSDLRTKLNIPDSDNPIKIHAWIVDTSIEYDQLNINDFLKISLEGLRIILRDEQHLLNNKSLEKLPTKRLTLYPGGFSAERFCEIVEKGELWSFLDDDNECRHTFA